MGLFVQDCIAVSRKNGRCPHYYINHCSALLHRHFLFPAFFTNLQLHIFWLCLLYLFKAIHICLLLSIWVSVNNSSCGVGRKKDTLSNVKYPYFENLKSWQTWTNTESSLVSYRKNQMWWQKMYEIFAI